VSIIIIISLFEADLLYNIIYIMDHGSLNREFLNFVVFCTQTALFHTCLTRLVENIWQILIGTTATAHGVEGNGNLRHHCATAVLVT
jgi:hypothetical protein